MIEKRGVVDPAVTNDTERKVPAGEKQAGTKAATEKLDDDFTKRAAEKAAKKLNPPAVGS